MSPDDVMAGKMDALYNRAAARDFLDIDAAIGGGHYPLERLCQLAETVDAGFDRVMFGRMLRYVERFDPEDFAEYGVDALEAEALLARVAAWRRELETGESGPLAGH